MHCLLYFDLLSSTRVPAGVLATAQLSVSSILTLRQAGPAWVAGPRDEPRNISGISGRFVRAHRNLLEILPQFVAVLFLVHAADSISSLSVWGAWAFFAARLAYVPSYAFGPPGLRSVFWQIAFFGIVAILVDAVI